MIEKKNIKDIYELSPLQRGILFHYLQNRESHSYFEQMTLTLSGHVHISWLEESLNALIRTYDIFRTVFDYSSFKIPVQIVLKERSIPLHYEDISGLNDRNKEEYIAGLRLNDRNQGFDLTAGDLLRFKLLKWGDEEYKLLWSHHHILMDGWCIGIILRDFLQHYGRLAGGKPVSAVPAPPYSSYVKWLQQQDVQTAKQFWADYLLGYESCTGIPLQEAKTSEDYEFAQVVYEIGEELSGRLAELAQAAEVTISSAFQAVWGILLQKYNSTNDAVFGSVISGRSAAVPQIEEMVGLFINTIPVRVKGKDGSTVTELMAGVQQHILESEQFSYISLPEMTETVSVKGARMDHVLVFENYPLDLPGLHAEANCPFEIADIEAFEQTNYDLDVTIYPGERIKIVFTFNQRVYGSSFISRIGEHLEHIIRQVADNPSISIGEIELMTERERERIVHAVTSRAEGESQQSPMTVTKRFEEQVRLYPDHDAIQMEDEKFTYAELNRRIHILAMRLMKQGIQQGDYVGIRLERSPQMAIAILAVLKIGAAYVPIRPEDSAEWVHAMMRLGSFKHVISSRNIPPLPGMSAMVLWMEEAARPEGEDLASLQTEPSCSPGDPVYMVFR